MCLGAKLDQHLGAKLETGTLPCEFPHQALAELYNLPCYTNQSLFNLHFALYIQSASQGPILGLFKPASTYWSGQLNRSDQNPNGENVALCSYQALDSVSCALDIICMAIVFLKCT